MRTITVDGATYRLPKYVFKGNRNGRKQLFVCCQGTRFNGKQFFKTDIVGAGKNDPELPEQFAPLPGALAKKVRKRVVKYSQPASHMWSGATKPATMDFLVVADIEDDRDNVLRDVTRTIDRRNGKIRAERVSRDYYERTGLRLLKGDPVAYGKHLEEFRAVSQDPAASIPDIRTWLKRKGVADQFEIGDDPDKVEKNGSSARGRNLPRQFFKDVIERRERGESLREIAEYLNNNPQAPESKGTKGWDGNNLRKCLEKWCPDDLRDRWKKTKDPSKKRN